jgi:hypothetical protein
VDLKRLRVGEWLAAAGGIALIVSLVIGGTGSTVIDVLLAALAVVALALGVLQATQTSPAKPVAAGVLTVTFGAVGVLLVVIRLIVAGDDWLGLLATAAITAGGWLSIGNEHVRGLPPGPEPEVRPSPRIADRAQP